MKLSGMIDHALTAFFNTLKTYEKCSNMSIEGWVCKAISMARSESSVQFEPVITTVQFKISNKALNVSLSHFTL